MEGNSNSLEETRNPRLLVLASLQGKLGSSHVHTLGLDIGRLWVFLVVNEVLGLWN